MTPFSAAWRTEASAASSFSSKVGIGDLGVDETHGLVLEDPRRLARRRILLDLAAGRDRGIPGDARQLESQAVGQDHVPVEAVDADGIVRRHGVDPILARQLDRRELLVVPIAVQDPAARSELPGLGRDAGDEVRAVLRVAELDALQGESSGQEMGVAVDEAGKNERPAEVDELRPGAGERPQLGRLARREDPAVPDGHRLGPGPCGYSRPDLAVEQYEVDHVPLRSGLAALDEPKRQDDCQYAADILHYRSFATLYKRNLG